MLVGTTLLILLPFGLGFTAQLNRLQVSCVPRFGMVSDEDSAHEVKPPISSGIRRQIMIGSVLALGPPFLVSNDDAALAVERAVGSAEQACRDAGNCLERGDWDAAVGWNWGGKDRCDATDPRCGPNGVLLDAPPEGEPVPNPLSQKLTHVVEMAITVGKGRSESGILRLGLYGEAEPKSVQQLVEFLSPSGLVTTPGQLVNAGLASTSLALTMSTGLGLLTGISPGSRLLFGIPSQAAAFSRSSGISIKSSKDNFVPQERPSKEELQSETSVRSHDVAGLVSIPGNGLGYADNGPLDEAFSNAFQITASAVPSMDREGRKVVGQVMDADSMAFLARLASLPTNKGLKGIVPGQDSGPPLLKVVVQNVQVKSVST